MAQLRIRCFGGSFWPPQPSLEAVALWNLHLTMQFTQWLPAEEIRLGQLAQFRILLAHCLSQVPFYRSEYAKLGIQYEAIQSWEDFQTLPLLHRSAVAGRVKEFHAEQLPAEVIPVGEDATAGRKHTPLVVRQTNVSQRLWQAIYLRELEWMEADQMGNFAVLRPMGQTPEQKEMFGNGVAQRHWSPPIVSLLETGPCFGMDSAQSPQKQLAWLQKIRPTYLISYPSTLLKLAEVLPTGNNPIPTLVKIQSMGEPLSAQQKLRIEQAFSVPVRNIYSSTETGYIANTSPVSDELLVHAEGVIVEVLNEHNLPCAVGETGRVVVTTLQNFVQPMIRYELGDWATVGAPATCGRGLPVLSQVHGSEAL